MDANDLKRYSQMIKPARKPRQSRVDREIEHEIDRLFYKHGANVQFNVMDLSKITQAGKQAHAAGQDIEPAIIAAIAAVRKN